MIDAILAMLSEVLGAQVLVGSLPPGAGYAIQPAGGAPMETFRELDTNSEFLFALNGKDTDQERLSAALWRAHRALTTSKDLPFSDVWQIYAIETTASPQLIGREENKYWLYGSSLRVKFYAKGIETNA